ncbi:MAG: phosphohydrolase, partial [Gammaproteobacteria bacterium]|nr:phosphohydrolase [Gammaproteobacteria bacterium]
RNNEIIGLLCLLFKRGKSEIQANNIEFVEALSGFAAVTLESRQLFNMQEALLHAFIKLMAGAIDAKSPYTGGHCLRVPEITMMLATAACDSSEGKYKDFELTDKQWDELTIAGWLHDCGKVTTPEYVVDKATKLETIYDRINTVDARFEVLKRDATIDCMQQKIDRMSNDASADTSDLDNQLQEKLQQLDDDRDFIRKSNVGGEFMDEALQQRVRDIAEYRWIDPDGVNARFFNDDEIKNLTIAKGTLTDVEREVIQNHMAVTIKMLAQLPFPKHLKNVPEYAGGHHERMDGKGYPKGLTRDQMSVQARMMGIADIFEALSASDRPYKTGKPLTECLRILGFMKKDNHVDPDIFDVFVRDKVYMNYAETFLPKNQIDEVIHSEVPGFDE